MYDKSPKNQNSMNVQYVSEDVKFITRSYGVTELGMLYSPALQPASAARALRRWINYNRSLKQALVASGWTEGQRRFTPLQVELIARHLGEP